MASAGTEAKFKWQDGLGIAGMFLGIAAMTDMPIYLRLGCFAACAICMPISFFSHTYWLLWVRLLASSAIIGLMTYVGCHAWLSSLPKIIQPVFLEWGQPVPMEYGTPLSGLQLNAKALSERTVVPGSFTYNPTFGASLPPGMDTLSVEFSPSDSSRFQSVKQTMVVLVKEPPAHSTAPAPQILKRPVVVKAPVTQGGSNSPCQANAVGGNATVRDCNAGPAPLQIKSTQSSVASENPQKFRREVRVTSNVEWNPVSLDIECSVAISSIYPGGPTSMMFYPDGYSYPNDPKKGHVSFEGPNVPAGEAVVIEVLADQAFTCDAPTLSNTPRRRNLAEGAR